MTFAGHLEMFCYDSVTNLSDDDITLEELLLTVHCKSTGKPNVAMIEWCSISNSVQNSQPYGYRPGVRVLSSLAYALDSFVVDVFSTLSCGATLVTGRKEHVPGDIRRATENPRINVVHYTPSILAAVPLGCYPTLESVAVTGEVLGKLIEDQSNRAKFMNMYGPTDASVDCVHTHGVGSGTVPRHKFRCRSSSIFFRFIIIVRRWCTPMLHITCFRVGYWGGRWRFLNRCRHTPSIGRSCPDPTIPFLFPFPSLSRSFLLSSSIRR